MSRKTVLSMLLIFVMLAAWQPYAWSRVYAQDASTSPRENIVLVSAPEAKENEPYVRMLRTLGRSVTLTDSGSLERLDWAKVKLLVLPGRAASALDGSAAERIAAEVSKGMPLYTEQRTPLSEKLALAFDGTQVTVSGLSDAGHPEADIRWANSQTIEGFASRELSVFAKDAASGTPVVAGGKRGEGKFLYSAVALGEGGSYGYERLPYLHEYLAQWFEWKPQAERPRLSVFMDWGYHYQEDPYELADRLKSYGVSEVHLSTWYELEQIASFYKSFIEAAHSNGISVYAWIELPMVSQAFWEAHPEWRQKTAQGEDAHLDWRYLMALEDPACMEAVKAELRKRLAAFAWDGANLAELYFESPASGPEDPSKFTPMSGAFRQSFQAKHGYDPLEAFDAGGSRYFKTNAESLKQLTDFRAQTVLDQNRELMQYLKSLSGELSLGLWMTQIDSLHESNMRQNIGVDSQQFIRLQNEQDFTLQIEDPYTMWGLGPDRYEKLGKAYRAQQRKGEKLAIDINIVERSAGLPTKKQTGLEFLMLVSEAAKQADTVTVYAVNTVNPQDWSLASQALAGTTSIVKRGEQAWETANDRTVRYAMNTQGKRFSLDGKPWPFVDRSGIWVPGGRHRIEAADDTQRQAASLSITDLNAEIVDGSVTEQGVAFSYEASGPAYIRVSEWPGAVIVDGQAVTAPVFYKDGQYVVKLPKGKHAVQLSPSSGGQTVRLALNRTIVPFTEPPVVVDGTSLFPLADLLQAMGAKYEWSPREETVSAEREGYVLWLQLNNPLARANGEDVRLEVPAILRNEKTMVPLRFVSEALHYEVKWNEPKQVIEVRTKKD
ncbi:stalk domain-containing protein [Paenibacillus tyrfis]|uniref:stalk domain-containing protein n=1 Tax=Paenibacillus tyrfis TaxID=1501230 RepID=UPI002491CA60|nr:stalk domain-containing protein [Paenibacillus tyrfis]